MSLIEDRLRDLADDYRSQATVPPDLLARIHHAAQRRARRRAGSRILLAVACLAVVVVSLAAVVGGRGDEVEDAGSADDLAPASSTVTGAELVGLVCARLDADLEGSGPVFQTLPAYEGVVAEWSAALAGASALVSTAAVDSSSASTLDELLGALDELDDRVGAIADEVERGDVVAAGLAYSALEQRARELLPEATGIDIACGRFS